MKRSQRVTALKLYRRVLAVLLSAQVRAGTSALSDATANPLNGAHARANLARHLPAGKKSLF